MTSRLESLPALLSYEGAARELSLTPEGVRTFVRQGRIAVVKLGRLPRIPRSEIERIVREGIGARKESK